MRTAPREPSTEECESRTEIEPGRFACWYPQMVGGYSGKAVVEIVSECFDCYVWHDGEFPFTEDSSGGCGPFRLHHCGADQFIEFGEFVEGLMDVQ